MYEYLGTTGIKMNDLLQSIYVISVVLVGLIRTKRKTLKKAGEAILFSGVQLLPGLLHFPFGRLVGTGANYFGTLFTAPFFIIIACFIFKKNFLEKMDIITPAYALGLVFIKLACFCNGCCRGIRTPYGLFNYDTQQAEFPIQLVEAGLVFLIFFFLLFWERKAAKGTLYPLYMIIYSGTRFFSEFLRCEKNVFGILKTYHILCIIGIIVGVIQWYLVKRYGEKIEHMFLVKERSMKKTFIL